MACAEAFEVRKQGCFEDLLMKERPPSPGWLLTREFFQTESPHADMVRHTCILN